MSRDLDAECARAFAPDVRIAWRLTEWDHTANRRVEIQSWYERHPNADRVGLQAEPCTVRQTRSTETPRWDVVAAYSTDHAAARLLEDEAERRGLQWPYARALCGIVGGQRDALPGILWLFIRATPEQRARAFLEVLRVSSQD